MGSSTSDNIDTPASVDTAPGRRHVWVAPVAGGSTPHAGLVHAWRRGPRGWQARVTYIVEDGAPEGVTVTQWVSADVVRPA